MERENKIGGLRINVLEKALADADRGESILPEEVLQVSGFSSPKIKMFFNNLCKESPHPAYLEIGTMLGSTLINAAYNNQHGEFYGIDNFCGFGGPQNEAILNANIDKFKDSCNITFIKGNCWDADVKNQVPKGINIFFFDGEHTYEEQYKALVEYYDKLADKFIFIVDDWNWDAPREATHKSIFDLGLEQIMFAEFFTPNKENGRADSWWNGLGVFLLAKK